MMITRRSLLSGSACIGLLSVRPMASLAQVGYPSRPIRVLVTDPAGAAVDIVTRIFAERLQGTLGQPFVIENRPGGTGLIAAQATASAPPDGYTLFAAAASTFTVMPVQNQKANINLDRELTPVGFFGQLPQIIAGPSSLRAGSLAELIDQARRDPGTINCGTNGSGTLPHFTAKKFVEDAKAPITVVPYAAGGTSAVMADILGGRIQLVVSSLSALQGLVRSGDLKVLGVATPERLRNYPDWPTVAETVPGFSAVGWSAMFAPAQTPTPVLEELNQAMRAIANEPAIIQRLEELGTYPKPMTLTEVISFVQSEQRLWWPIVKATLG